MWSRLAQGLYFLSRRSRHENIVPLIHTSNWNCLHHHTSIQHLPTDPLLLPVKKSFPRLAEQSTGYQDRPSRLAKSESTHEQHPLPEPSLPSSSSLSPSSSPSQPVLILAVATTLTSSSPPREPHPTLKKHGTTKQAWQLHPPTESSPPSLPTTGQTTQSMHGWPNFLDSRPNSHDNATWRT